MKSIQIRLTHYEMLVEIAKKNEKDRFFKGLIPDYPEYPSTESFFELAVKFIKGMEGKRSY